MASEGRLLEVIGCCYQNSIVIGEQVVCASRRHVSNAEANQFKLFEGSQHTQRFTVMYGCVNHQILTYSVRAAFPRSLRSLRCQTALCTGAAARPAISARRRRVFNNCGSSSGPMRICAANAISSSTRAAEVSPLSDRISP